MKKIIAMILAAAMMLAVTACNAKPEEKETVELPEGFDPHYTATVIEDDRLPFAVELPDALGEVKNVIDSNDDSCRFQMTTGCSVVASKMLDGEDMPPEVTSLGDIIFIVTWAWDGIWYGVTDLTSPLKNTLCGWLGELFAAE